MKTRRIVQSQDPVRREIELAIDYRVQIVPILLAKTEMPRAHQIPESLRVLTRRVAPPLRPTDFSDDAARLAEIIDKLLAKDVPAPPVGASM